MSEEPGLEQPTDIPETPSRRRSWFDPVRIALLGVIVLIIALLTGLGLPFFLDRSSDDPPEVERAQLIDPPKELQDFTLVGSDGQPVRLSDFQGQPLLMFFGYTHCPDVCPTTMAEFRQVKQELGEDGDRLNYVFISVDGSRDTPEIAGQYAARFDPSFIGLTGTEEQVRIAGQDYFLYFQHAETDTESASGYLVDHTASSYLIDDQGRLRYIYPFDFDRDVVVEDIQGLIS